MLYEFTMQFDEARQTLQPLLDGTDDVAAAAWLTTADLAWRDHDCNRGSDDEIACLRKAVALRPDWVLPRFFLGINLAAIGQQWEALQELEVARKLQRAAIRPIDALAERFAWDFTWCDPRECTAKTIEDEIAKVATR